MHDFKGEEKFLKLKKINKANKGLFLQRAGVQGLERPLGSLVKTAQF